MMNPRIVTTIKRKPRPTNGKRAFSDSEETEIFRLVIECEHKKEAVAAHLGVSMNTIENVVKRVQRREAGAA
jgi:predicted DNA-binding protein (UPF0251 family)